MSHTWVTDVLAADEVPLLQVTGLISPVNIGSLAAWEEDTVLTFSVLMVGIIRLLMTLSLSPSCKVPGAAVSPHPVPLLELVCSSDPDAVQIFVLQIPE